MKPVPFGPFALGMNNQAEDYALPRNDRGAQVAVRDAVNVDFSASGLFRRRRGMAVANTMTGAHSGWSDGTLTLFVRASKLYKIAGFTPYAETELTALSSNDPVSYAAVNGEVWFSNGTDFGRLSAADVVSPQALATPSAPVVTAATTSGDLMAGNYQVAITYAKYDGATLLEEGGATKATTVELTATGKLDVVLPAGAPGATHVNVYLSACNGEALTLHSSVAVGTLTKAITSLSAGRQLLTQFLSPLPAGQLAYSNGRLISWDGTTAYYSEPWALGLCNAATNFHAFPSDVRAIVPNQNGAYVVLADRALWYGGTDFANPEPITDVLPFGGAAYTTFHMKQKGDGNSLVGWYSDRGIVIGDTQGQVKLIQEPNVATDTAAAGAALVREQNGLRQVVVSLPGSTASAMAKTDGD